MVNPKREMSLWYVRAAKPQNRFVLKILIWYRPQLYAAENRFALFHANLRLNRSWSRRTPFHRCSLK